MINFKGFFYKGLGLFVIFLMGISFPASSAFAVIEIEDNNTFETRQILQFGTKTVVGGLGVETLYSFSGNLTAGLTDHFDITEGLSAGDPFFAWTDNFPSEVDTMLGLFLSDGTMIDYNDDDGPYHDYFGSGIDGTVNADDTIHMRVTGYEDYDFDGSGHEESGEYSLYVSEYVAGATGDNDFYSFTGLLPGSTFTADITGGYDYDFDTMLGWYGSDGSLIEYDDDSGYVDGPNSGYLSFIEGVVPEDGNLNFLVTGYDYFSDDSHTEQGIYVLTVVPEPISSTLFLIGAATLGFRQFRKRA